MARPARAPRRTALEGMLPPRRATGRATLAPTPPIRKPMARSTRVSLFDREVTVRLSPVGVDVLFAAPQLLVEGDVSATGYVGSTMLTFDLATTANLISDPPDAATAKRAAALMTEDPRTRSRARRIAIREAARAAGAAPLEPPQLDLRARAAGARIHLDIDVEARRKP